MNLLKDISVFWSLAHTLVIFMILFESRYSKKKTLLITLICMVPLLLANGILFLFVPSDTFGLLLLVTLSLPSLLFFFIISQWRDGRFLFTFCMVDTVALEIIYLAQIINFHTTPDTFIVMFLMLLVAFPLVEVLVWRLLRKPYQEVQRRTRKGWWLFAAISFIFYIFLTLFVNHPVAITERTGDYPVVLLLFLLMPLVYLHIMSALLFQQKQFEKDARESILRLQSANLMARVTELSETNDKFREERHNFRHKLRTIAMLAERQQYDELERVIREYTDTFKHTHLIRYCDNAILDAVLSHYISHAESLGIKTELGFDFPEQIPVDPAELATVLANGIENAIHACEKLPPSERMMEIKVIHKPQFIIRIKNRYNGVIEFGEDGIPVNHAEEHGFGTRSIVAFCNKVHGHYAFKADGSYFSLILNL